MLSDPSFRLSEVGTDSFDFAPEPLAVVHLTQMHEFMDHDVIPNMIRHLNQSPVERDVSTPGTRAPTRSLIANGDPLDRQPVEFCQLQGLRRKLDGSQLAKMALDGRTETGCVRDMQRLVAELNEMTVVIWTDDERKFLASIQNLGSVLL
jgi:hypothetical protein